MILNTYACDSRPRCRHPDFHRRTQKKERAELARNARVDVIARDSLKMIPIVPDRTLYLNQAPVPASGGAQ